MDYGCNSLITIVLSHYKGSPQYSSHGTYKASLLRCQHLCWLILDMIPDYITGPGLHNTITRVSGRTTQYHPPPHGSMRDWAPCVAAHAVADCCFPMRRIEIGATARSKPLIQLWPSFAHNTHGSCHGNCTISRIVISHHLLRYSCRDLLALSRRKGSSPSCGKICPRLWRNKNTMNEILVFYL